uniref:DUF4935 domain-containing protein n=1 Tax=Magnetococcus massalia (strain MO-1) TaxID=451514 RepID=A0A1S7LJL6_MAGMO|nr:protein of unknown function [Candidatus Magnetococcus massalia]
MKKYGAVSIDTTVFHQKHRRLDSGLLSGLTQFSGDSPLMKLVLSEVVYNEVIEDTAKDNDDYFKKFCSAASKAIKHKLVTNEDVSALNKIKEQVLSPYQLAEKIFSEYCSEKNIHIIPSSCDVGLLSDMYFRFSPPFENNKNKRHEFPDAIALLSIESWAKENSCRVLVASSDTGWAKFADNSDWIDVLDSLEGVLSYCFDNASHINYLASVFVADVFLKNINSKFMSFLNEIKKEVVMSIEFTSFEFMLDSSTYWDIDDWGIDVSESSLVLDPESIECSVCDFDDDWVSLMIVLDTHVNYDLNVRFFTYDSIDREEVDVNVKNLYGDYHLFDIEVTFKFSLKSFDLSDDSGSFDKDQVMNALLDSGINELNVVVPNDTIYLGEVSAYDADECIICS